MTSEFTNKLIKIIIEAGNLIEKIKNDKFAYKIVENKQYKSEIDNIINDFLIKNLNQAFPSIPIFSEECNNKGIDLDVNELFILDPIDGTASLINGFNGYVCQLAYAKNGEIFTGIVYAPYFRDLWFCEKGNGVFFNKKKIKPLFNFDLIKLIDNTSYPSEELMNYIKKFKEHTYIESGSIGLKMCKIIDGTSNLFIKNVPLKIWDIAPTYVMSNELGYILRDFNKKEINIKIEDVNGIIFCNSKEIYDQLNV